MAQWLSPADLRRARLVCKTWYSALATLTTKAATPAETLVPQWKGQLEAMLQAFPCLQQLTISSRLSSVAAQQLGVLATAKQLQVLNIPHAQALQDRSLLVSTTAAGVLAAEAADTSMWRPAEPSWTLCLCWALTFRETLWLHACSRC